MKADAINTVFLPLALGVIMLGLGLGLRLDDFKRIVAYPKAVAIGLASQMLILPLVCLGIAHAFDLAPELAVGLMLLAASPGGATANLFSHLAKGDVALNITLTATNSVLSVITLPLLVSFSMNHFLGKDHAIPLQLGKVISVVSVVLVPVAIGMLVRSKRPGLADRLDRPVRIVSAVFLMLVILAAVFRERAHVGDYLQQVGLAALAFNLASLFVGYVVPRVLRVERKQAIAIGMEIGIHNGTLAIAVALNVLESPTMSIPPAVYSLISFFTAAAFGVLVARRAA